MMNASLVVKFTQRGFDLGRVFQNIDTPHPSHPTSVSSTGRQLRTLSSVMYRIFSKRRYILAAQLLLREKSGT